MPRWRRRFGCLVLLGVASACKHETESSDYPISVFVEGDAKAPLAGAAILNEGAVLGTTGSDGRVALALRGKEGDSVSLSVRCPEGHASPKEPLQVPLRRLQDPSRPPSYGVACPPTQRTVVIAVRANNGPNLPVLYLGKEVARTDSSGAAHLELHLRPGERFELTLSTREAGAEHLIPQNPSAVFVVSDRDEVLVFNQNFEVAKVKAGAPVRRGPQPF